MIDTINYYYSKSYLTGGFFFTLSKDKYSILGELNHSCNYQK